MFVFLACYALFWVDSTLYFPFSLMYNYIDMEKALFAKIRLLVKEYIRHLPQTAAERIRYEAHSYYGS